MIRAENKSEKSIQHMVFFWLKNPLDEKSRAIFENSMRTLLSTSKFTKNAYFGIPSSINRAVVDTSYTYCLTINFKNLEEHNNYQIDSAHKLFIAECSNLWDKVQIYDSESL
ncbi:Dabb family protein [Lutibacter sp.]|uniref:Dabb family protein n=1 Tax=Lutibacter sp. TaxID=1925666 RepID=UPI003569A483